MRRLLFAVGAFVAGVAVTAMAGDRSTPLTCALHGGRIHVATVVQINAFGAHLQQRHALQCVVGQQEDTVTIYDDAHNDEATAPS